MDKYIEPPKNQSASIKASSNHGLNIWTLSYRLKGMTIGLALAALYSYFYLHFWSATLLIASGILGYSLGWVVGHISFRSGK